jgi:UDP-N-acetylmuramoylalanine--D-glutamate ligase
MELKGKKVTVVGLGRSGVAACNLLVEKGAKVRITECLDNQRIRDNLLKLKNKENIIQIEIGRHTEDLIAKADLIVASPGVSIHSLPFLWAKKHNVAVIGEIELAFAFCPAPIVAITGTNGKTTVSTLLGQIFTAAGRRCVVCGNIGTPFSEKVKHLTSTHAVILEVSSFQLETIVKFKPKVAVILNLSIDHLDRHADFDEYLAAKCRLFSNQDQKDWTVLNGEDPHRFTLAAKTKASVLYFFKNNQVLSSKFENFNSNYSAALTISSLFSIPQTQAIDTCRNFRGIEHRMEDVGQICGVTFINDSKATNVHSTLWALNLIKKPIILIAGGRDKGSDFSLIKDRVRDKVKAMVLLGEAKEKMEKVFCGLTKTQLASNLSQALMSAFALARWGDCVLLSPMCASFDMFSDYTERGRVFKQEVKSLVQGSKFKV